MGSKQIKHYIVRLPAQLIGGENNQIIVLTIIQYTNANIPSKIQSKVNYSSQFRIGFFKNTITMFNC